MNEKQILQALEALGINALGAGITAGVIVLIAKNPNATDAELLADDEGTIKHALRHRIGWAVDLIWPEILPYLDAAIRQAIATVCGTQTLSGVSAGPFVQIGPLHGGTK